MVDNGKKFGIEEFLDEYRYKIEELKQKAYSTLQVCYEKIKFDKNVEDFFIDIKNRIDALKSFSAYSEKIENLKNARKECKTTFYQYASYCDETKDYFDPFNDSIDQIIICITDYNTKIKERIDDWFARIKACPFGEAENRVKNAKEFENCVLNLMDWVFVNELERMDLRDIQDGSQRRDGGYKVLPEFNTQLRCSFPFRHLFIECKNYGKPSYKDLMQVLAYTLFCQESKIFQMPLSILISRENPTEDSLSWRMRSIIFSRKIQDETRLILFLDQKDIAQMIKYRKENGDPVLVFKEKIEELASWNIKRGGYY